MREIVLDTETTGLDPQAGHRVVEVACLELVNHVPTGNSFQKYVNPEREMPLDAFAVHGLSSEFLASQPRFAEIVDSFLEFIGNDTLVIHNAEFDLSFINAELERVARTKLERERAVDTVSLARRKFPGAQASLDALCRRFSIDATARAKHGALLDCELLAQVYLELVGGREPGLSLADARTLERAADSEIAAAQPRPPRRHAPSEAELAQHAAFLAKLKDPVWLG
ncbi:MAG: DNA polymerase III subunit epsilon [Proteobacteria bacterium]|nr:DNA polymerase III subunit epsilon [Pseudomonadota bacterium]